MAKDNRNTPSILPNVGDRAIAFGHTGSGKTLFTCWALLRLPLSPTIIYDTKNEDKFLSLPKAKVVGSLKEIDTTLEDGETDYIVFRPPARELSDPAALDEYLMYHYENFPRVTCYVDELVSFHRNGRAGPGLVAILTRGRSEGITFFGASQRPAWISLYLLTEAQHLYVFRLNHEKDKKRISEVIPHFDEMPEPHEYAFWYYNLKARRLQMYHPIKPDKGLDTGYTKGDNRTVQKPVVVEVERHDWL